jgi:hypothetical protein
MECSMKAFPTEAFKLIPTSRPALDGWLRLTILVYNEIESVTVTKPLPVLCIVFYLIRNKYRPESRERKTADHSTTLLYCPRQLLIKNKTNTNHSNDEKTQMTPRIWEVY